MTSVECVVVGAGPGGLSAALTAAQAGVKTWLLDENHQLGGQYYRSLPRDFFGRNEEIPESLRRQRESLIRAVHAAGVHVRPDTTVWGVFDGKTLGVLRGEVVEEVTAQTLILATGAQDRPVPFPGWTLPGVITAGAAQNLLKGYGVLPGRRVLIVGSGPLLLQIAYNLLKAGAHVEAVCEASPVAWWSGISLWRHPDLIWQGSGYLGALRWAHVPFLPRTIVQRALGVDAVEGAVVARWDPTGRVLPGSEREFRIDALVVGYGFVPATELSWLVGCQHRYDATVGAWVPLRDANLETSVEGIFVAGDGGGVAGARSATIQGQLAGLTAAWKLGRLSPGMYEERAARLKRALRHMQGLRSTLERLYVFRPEIYDLATADTPLCRCEEVTREAVLQAANNGAATLNELRVRTRAGMGRCQGRFCSLPVAHTVAKHRGVPVDMVGFFSARPPVKPVPMRALLGGPMAV